MEVLVLQVRLHDGRYHGEGDWPPSPARLFQALVAGAGLGGSLGRLEQDALRWLERLRAPIIAAPNPQHHRSSLLLYLPNNDGDSIGGDPARMAKIRTATKVSRPHIFNERVPFVYAWSLLSTPAQEPYVRTVRFLANRLYQFGRGVDMAWAWADVTDGSGLEALLEKYPGHVFRPSASGGLMTLPIPSVGSFDSLERRYRAQGERFRYLRKGRAGVSVVFHQPPRPRFGVAAYESPPVRQLYELRDSSAEARFSPWRLREASALVVRLRDAAVARLQHTLPGSASEIERVLVGRKPDGTNAGPIAARVRILPLPSIGHPHADSSIRRVMVEVPAECPLPPDVVHWAFAGAPFHPVSGELLGPEMTRAADERILHHYGIARSGGWRTWRSVTPVALPAEQRSVATRHDAEARAAVAVEHSLRQAGRRLPPETIRVQREPFTSPGDRADAFASGTRFTRDRLWHVEITFPKPITGPLVLGDGRFLGLGVMYPIDQSHGVHVFVIEGGLTNNADPTVVARALRRAVMSSVQSALGREGLPPFFSGHAPNGEPARADRFAHLTFLLDPGGDRPARLLVIGPHVVERRDPTAVERQHLRDLDSALIDFRELRAGSAGLLTLRPASLDFARDPLFAPAKTWESVTSYQVTRHARKAGINEALAADVRAECRRCGLPEPNVSAHGVVGVPGTGLTGSARLEFDTAVAGPIVLGRSRYLGGGVFAGQTGR